ncbi:MAG: adenylate/guanylate cyclase domain-containing protein [Planctomycetota bacterium]
MKTKPPGLFRKVFRPHFVLIDLESRLKGTRWGHIAIELFTNSIHFPLANMLVEFLSEGFEEFAKEPDRYIIIPVALVQAFFLGSWHYKNNPKPLVGNLIGPLLYTLFEIIFEGIGFFGEPQHIAYWVFSFLIGLLQQLRVYLRGRFLSILILFENIVRAGILLVMYWILESLTTPKYSSPAVFLSEKEHIFITATIFLFGVVIGLANIYASHYFIILQETAAQLKKYSEWLFGREILSKAVPDHGVLALQSQNRTVFFMDIRGFTAWSESQPPEKVVAMLNTYYETAERIWTKYPFVKIKFSGDEIMIVFPSAETAARAAVEISKETGKILKLYGLRTGIGLHSGRLVEGLIGSRDVKIYDVIGDTVNTAKRICDAAGPDEVLISQNVYTELGASASPDIIGANGLPAQTISVKGKIEPLTLYLLLVPPPEGKKVIR